MERKLAVFDVDGTIFRSSLVIELVEELVKKGIFPEEAEAEYIREYNKWLNRDGGYDEYIDSVVRAFGKYMKGAHYGDVMEVAKDVIAETGRRTYRYTRELIKQLKKDGYYLLAVSHSPKLIVDLFCDDLGFDKVYGTMYEIGPENQFTGTIAEEHIIFNKANVVKRVIEKEKLTLTDSVGVGDTESDISFLEKVALPICFNPNNTLYQYAKREQWKIIVERKDVIYEIQ